MQHLSKANPIQLHLIILLLRLAVSYERAYAYVSALRSPVVIFRERRKAIQAYRQERRMSAAHWIGVAYPERKKYIVHFLGHTIHLWISVDVAPTQGGIT
jgi:hypothetical protein